MAREKKTKATKQSLRNQKNSKQTARARAYCSSANLGPGFDVFGLALDAFYDEVSITRMNKRGTDSARRKITITYEDVSKGKKSTKNNEKKGQSAPRPPTDPNSNTAGLVVKYMLDKHGITDDVEISIRKGVPTGLGLGSSAASAAAAAVACNKLFGLKYTATQLVTAAGQGEKASAGTIHYDNVAASVVGGFVIVKPSDTTVIMAGFKPASDLRFCVAIPTIDVPDKKTKVSRGVLPKKIPLKDSIQNIANASLLATCLATKDSNMLNYNITADSIAEPARKHMIPGFDALKEAALEAGAKGVMISGAGPSVIAIVASSKANDKVAKAMSAGFESANIRCQTVLCKPARGAQAVASTNKKKKN